MKKLLFVAVATFMFAFVSCNSGATTETTETSDSTANDTTMVVDSVAADTVVAVDSVAK